MRTTHLPQLVHLQFPPCTILILLNGTQKEIDLRNHNLGQGVGPCWTTGAGARASTEDARV